MQPTLVVIGLNHRSAPVEIRERFWMSGCRQAEALSMLSQAEGIAEVVVFSTCNRTEFVVWGDPTLAVNSVLRFLTAEYDLKLCEWNNFYRLLDERALVHAFRVSCGLDSMCIGEGHVARQVNSAWQQARHMGSSGRCLDVVLRKALSVRRRIRKETTLGTQLVSAPVAAVELATRLFGSLANRNVVLLGAGNAIQIATWELARRGAGSVLVVNREEGRAASVAKVSNFRACSAEARQPALAEADLVISATSAPEFIFTAADMKELSAERKGRKLVLIDLALPRDIDPQVREFEGVLLYDLEDLERAVEPRSDTRAGEPEAEGILLAEVQAFRKEFMAEQVAPDPTDLRHRLEEICRKELESFRLEQGPFPKEQDELISTISTRLAHRIAGALAREIKGHQDPRKPGRMSAAV